MDTTTAKLENEKNKSSAHRLNVFPNMIYETLKLTTKNKINFPLKLKYWIRSQPSIYLSCNLRHTQATHALTRVHLKWVVVSNLSGLREPYRRQYLLCGAELIAWPQRYPNMRNAEGTKHFLKQPYMSLDSCIDPYYKMTICHILA